MSRNIPRCRLWLVRSWDATGMMLDEVTVHAPSRLFAVWNSRLQYPSFSQRRWPIDRITASVVR